MTIPYRFEVTATTAELRAAHDGLDAGEETGIEVTVAGRVMLHRAQGKLAFATLRDGSGGEIQLFALAAVTDDFAGFEHISLGDWVGATGEVVKTKRGELSVKVTTWTMLAETRRSFGDKFHGLTDVDTRYRQRYADLWANPETRTHVPAAQPHPQPHAPLARGPRASSRWRRRSSTRSPAARWPSRSPRTTTRSTWSSSCGSRRSST